MKLSTLINFVSSLVKKCDSILLLPVDSSYYKRSKINCHLFVLLKHQCASTFTYTHFFSNWLLFLHICYKIDGFVLLKSGASLFAWHMWVFYFEIRFLGYFGLYIMFILFSMVISREKNTSVYNWTLPVIWYKNNVYK